MKRTLILSIPMLALAAAAFADDAPTLTAAVVDPSAKASSKPPASDAAAVISPRGDERSQLPSEETSKPRGGEASQPRSGESSKPPGDVQMSGMSVLGNDEAPKSLVLVPWKSSQLADAPGLSKMLDDGTQPVDKEVFLRELDYYQLKIDSK
jgi:hypothetical protein